MSKGCVVSWHSAGTGMRGLADYGLDKDGAEVINSNCGYDPISIKQGLTRAVKNCQRVKHKACHLTISLPPTTAPRSADQWQDIVDKTRQELGLHSGFSYVAVRHTDTSNDHIHIIFSKISDEGKTWRDSNIRYKLPPLEKLLTEKFGLPPTPADQYATKGHINKNEIEWKIREGEQPPSVYIRNAIAEASKNSDVLLFIQSLADAGITVRPNLKEGELNGFGYSYDGISYTGKSLGANWSELKKVVIYDKNIHLSTLADLKREIDARKAGGVQLATGANPLAEPDSPKSDGTGLAAVTTISEPAGTAGTTDSRPEKTDSAGNQAKRSITAEILWGARKNRETEYTVNRNQVGIESHANISPSLLSDYHSNIYRHAVLDVRPLNEQLQLLQKDAQQPLNHRNDHAPNIYRRVLATAYLLQKKLVDRIRALYIKKYARQSIPVGFNTVKPKVNKIASEEVMPSFK